MSGGGGGLATEEEAEEDKKKKRTRRRRRSRFSPFPRHSLTHSFIHSSHINNSLFLFASIPPPPPPPPPPPLEVVPSSPSKWTNRGQTERTNVGTPYGIVQVWGVVFNPNPKCHICN
ncbi:hypothetical protein niasHT_025457 [Heterodera trifolii]|uniref:Uncharacterized protein n=1 Tax=Heterodera trifolii TaxID=157864 RepID=A0ABD2JX81_9BILA